MLSSLLSQFKGKDAAYMYRINQLLEVVIMLLPAVSLRHLYVKRANGYLAKAKQGLKGISKKFLGDNSAGDKTQ